MIKILVIIYIIPHNTEPDYIGDCVPKVFWFIDWFSLYSCNSQKQLWVVKFKLKQETEHETKIFKKNSTHITSEATHTVHLPICSLKKRPCNALAQCHPMRTLKKDLLRDPLHLRSRTCSRHQPFLLWLPYFKCPCSQRFMKSSPSWHSIKLLK